GATPPPRAGPGGPPDRVNARRPGRVRRARPTALPTVGRMKNPNPEGDPERLLTPAGGVVAIAITLPGLDRPVPPGLSEGDYHRALRDQLPNLGAYAISLLVLAGFWRDHRTMFRTVRQVDAQVISLTVLGLGLAALLPFPTALISEYGDETVSVVVY